ncbi:MAG: sodium:solute symporter family protein [Sedimentisphaerales bacterium]|nr:sodium:solute symporter family protein [Sedimentisphaerales bacterium]
MDLSRLDLNKLDIVVLVGYFVAIVAYGLWLSRRVKSSDNYFRGERKFSWWIMMGQSFGTGTHAENFTAQTGKTFQGGFSMIWLQWKNMLATPFYWLLAPWYRRSERTTVGEIVEDRYGRGMAFFYTVFALTFFVFCQGVMLKGAAKVISIAIGENVSDDAVIIFMSIAFILYSFFGGLVSSAHANFIQALMIIVLSMLLIPFGLREVDGISGLRNNLPDNFFRLFSPEQGMGLFTIAMLTLNGVVGITAQPHMLTMCATGNTERSGRIGQTFGSFVKRICTIGWAFTGLIVAALIVKRGQNLSDAEHAFGYAVRELLYPGLTGLMIACVLAANMSTCSNFMVNTGALFTRNLYKEFLRPQADDRHLLRIGRLSGLGLTILGVLFALRVKNVMDGFMFTETISAFVGIMVLGGYLWKRANRYGAAAATIVSFGLYYFLNWQQMGQLKLVYKVDQSLVPFGWAMLAGFAALIIVSLVTRKEPQEKIDAFYDNLDRLSDATPEQMQNGQKPPARLYGKDLILVDLPGFFKAERWKDFFRRYREDVIGFFLAWGMVGALVLIAWLVANVGA